VRASCVPLCETIKHAYGCHHHRSDWLSCTLQATKRARLASSTHGILKARVWLGLARCGVEDQLRPALNSALGIPQAVSQVLHVQLTLLLLLTRGEARGYSYMGVQGFNSHSCSCRDIHELAPPLATDHQAALDFCLPNNLHTKFDMTSGMLRCCSNCCIYIE
jgi:hypothetical protein